MPFYKTPPWAAFDRHSYEGCYFEIIDLTAASRAHCVIQFGIPQAPLTEVGPIGPDLGNETSKLSLDNDIEINIDVHDDVKVSEEDPVDLSRSDIDLGSVVRTKTLKTTSIRKSSIYIIDIGSANGTIVNGDFIKPREYIQIYIGAQIRLGPMSKCVLVLEGPESMKSGYVESVYNKHRPVERDIDSNTTSSTNACMNPTSTPLSELNHQRRLDGDRTRQRMAATRNSIGQKEELMRYQPLSESPWTQVSIKGDSGMQIPKINLCEADILINEKMILLEDMKEKYGNAPPKGEEQWENTGAFKDERTPVSNLRKSIKSLEREIERLHLQKCIDNESFLANTGEEEVEEQRKRVRLYASVDVTDSFESIEDAENVNGNQNFDSLHMEYACMHIKGMPVLQKTEGTLTLKEKLVTLINLRMEIASQIDNKKKAMADLLRDGGAAEDQKDPLDMYMLGVEKLTQGGDIRRHEQDLRIVENSINKVESLLKYLNEDRRGN